ncbi:hypothetical protein F3N42_11945 [Marinihelvus fidelis]|uniref:Uncharacterized protein n=1 Tax=Marinihelvus fidelis TaxID=2613842 RepID=A0A5N0T7M1_9GAMM|nr:hypothetical protein [Marinihelvus fidelis]KAA9131045.1 hypothetical protein F3N42_11945 [Marinihelvus fidelis]
MYRQSIISRVMLTALLATASCALAADSPHTRALPPVEGGMKSPPAEPLAVAESDVRICEAGENWTSLISQNGIGCDAACASQGMSCRRSYHDVAGECEPQPWELGCGQLSAQSTDFCACSSETFFQGKLYYEHPRDREKPALETCQAGDGWATIVFHDSSGCETACKSVGLVCHAAAEDLELECGPQADPEFVLACHNDLGHASDFCACTADGSATGLPDSVLSPWRPF